MTGLDTNVLVRYLTRDEPEQYQKAKTFLETHCTREQPGYISLIVLCELVWVLKAAYGADREELGRVIEALLLIRQVEIPDRDALWAALQAFRTSQADFADCLIGRLNRQAGCAETVTIDRRAGALEAFRLL